MKKTAMIGTIELDEEDLERLVRAGLLKEGINAHAVSFDVHEKCDPMDRPAGKYITARASYQIGGVAVDGDCGK